MISSSDIIREFSRIQFRAQELEESNLALGRAILRFKNTLEELTEVMTALESSVEKPDQKKLDSLIQKAQLISDGNTAILPNGEIIPRGTPGAMDY